MFFVIATKNWRENETFLGKKSPKLFYMTHLQDSKAWCRAGEVVQCVRSWKAFFVVDSLFFRFQGGAASGQRGFLGCIRALHVNGVNFDLDEQAKMTPGVSAGCPGQCSSSAGFCHNQGKCIEKSSGYVCDCTHSAYGGPSCKEGTAAFSVKRP